MLEFDLWNFDGLAIVLFIIGAVITIYLDWRYFSRPVSEDDEPASAPEAAPKT